MMFTVQDTIYLDSLSVVASSVYIEGVDMLNYQIDSSGSYLTWQKKTSLDSVLIHYRTIPFALSQPYFHKNISLIAPNPNGIQNPFSYQGTQPLTPRINNSNLNKNGSISRGIVMGNNQDLAVNSNLNLQLSGKISDNINVLASISDDNIPIQAEGNTQQLQEFDKVMIQLYNENNKLIAGDFQLFNPEENRYLKYQKKAQGGVYSNVFKSPKGVRVDTRGAAAISRGKFARNIIQGVEGNQGPYRLRGQENEQFVIVLSGTERVFIDGKQLTRGQDFDYIINYNTAEVTFTAKHLITKDKRIVVEFQYSDKNYARSLVQVSNSFKGKKWNTYLDVYSEQDAKNQPLQQELNGLQKSKLNEVGDSVHLAFAQAINEVEFSEDELLYKQEIIDGDTIYRFSTNPDSARYRLSFSYVGEGFGSYKQQTSTANGKVFQWAGKNEGAYLPVVLLIAPKKSQLVEFGGGYAFKNDFNVLFNGALSNADINTFSNLDREDNVGHAFKLALVKDISASKADTLSRVRISAEYEQLNPNFNEIERFRSVEFYRDWNLRAVDFVNTQHIGSFKVGYLSPKNSANYAFNVFDASADFSGFQNQLNYKLSPFGFVIDQNSSYTITETQDLSTSFFRTKGSIAKPIKTITIGVLNDFERNLQNTDSLLATSYQFLEWEGFVQNADTSKNTIRLSYNQRHEALPKNNALRDATLGKKLGLEVGLLKNRHFNLTNLTSFRVLEIKDSTLSAVKADSSFVNRLTYRINLFKGAITANAFYETGSGLEVKKDFTYIKVPTGQGLYVHNDNNQNGVKELDEFEIAPTQLQYQADYIKVFVPTNDYVKTFSNQFNQSVTIKPKAVWGSEKGLKKFVSRFTNISSILVDRKTTKKGLASSYNPFASAENDSLLVSQNSVFNNRLSFNPTSPVFGVNTSYQQNESKILLSNGFEQREAHFYMADIRLNVTKSIRVNMETKQGHKAFKSDYLSNRDYAINYYSLQPKITFQPGTVFRTSVYYAFKNKLNKSELNEQAIHNQATIELKWSKAEKGSFSSGLNFILIDYDFNTSGALAYEMLEGLQPGYNITWDVLYQRKLANNLQMNVNYNGRWSETAKMVHIGGLQLRAFF